jgi:hypothetical protein
MNTATQMRTSTSVRTQTAVHLTDIITGAFSAIIATLRLSRETLDAHWDTIEQGLMIWIEEGSLEDVCLEFGDPNAPEAIFEIPIEYRFTGVGNVEFVASRARLVRLTAKIEEVPHGTSYRVIANHQGSHTAVPGWFATDAANRSGLSSYNLGSLGSGPNASASLNYLTRRT